MPIAGLISKHSCDVSEQIQSMLSTTWRHGAAKPCGSLETGHTVPTAAARFNALKPRKDRAIAYYGLKPDVKAPVQPVMDIAGTFSLVFEGTIYDPNGVDTTSFNTLRDQRTYYPMASLFEGVLQGDHYAIAVGVSKVVSEFHGSFSLALMDAKYLVVARDVLGVEPVYWGENESYVGFASERKALWKTGIKHVAAFPPGYVAVISKDRVVQHCAVALERPTLVDVRLEDAAERLKKLLLRVFLRHLRDDGAVGVFFSGGVDSSLVAKCLMELGVAPVLYVAGFEGSPDLDSAERSAAELGCPLRETVLSLDEAEAYLPNVVYAVEEEDLMKISVGLPLYCAAETARKDGIRTVFSGQGVDELFGGYSRYCRILGERGVEALGEELWNNVLEVADVNIQRDKGITLANHIDLVLPFLDLDILYAVSSFPTRLKVESAKDGLRKHVLRATARLFGLSEDIVRRPKKAMQYGSGAQKAIRRIARRKGYRRAREYVGSVFQEVFKEFW